MCRNIKQKFGIPLIFLCFSNVAFSTVTLTNKYYGLEEPVLQNVTSRLDIIEKSIKGSLTYKDIQYLFQQTPKEIHKAVEPYGYFRATITKKLRHKKNNWFAYYTVHLGHRLRITQSDIQVIGHGSNDHLIQKLLHKLPIKIGEPFSIDTYEKAREDLLQRAQNRGYLLASFTVNKVIINSKKYTCAISLTLNTGPRYYFGSISFSLSPLSDNLLQRYIPFKQGSYFSINKLMQLQQDLSGSGYFKYVTATTHQDDKTQNIPVKVNLKMQRNKAYKFGIGYGTTTGIRGVLGFNWRWINRWGHKLHTLIRLSQTERNISAQYIIPGKRPLHEQYTITGGLYKIEPRHGKSYMQTIGIGFIRNYVKWQQTLSLEYQHEKYKLTDYEKYSVARMLVPTISFTHTSTKKIINTYRGSRFNIMLRGTNKGVFSSVSFLQAAADGKLIYSFLQDNRVILRGNLGYTIADADELPVSKQFYAGGMQSVRGFGYQYLGPGRYLLVGSAEYQRRVYKQFYGAVFYDTGNATEHFNMRLERSVGAGVVWQSPIGALQLYVARAISKKDKPYRLEFSLGPDL